MRHAESENNILDVSNTHDYNLYRLTKRGVEQTRGAYDALKGGHIDAIFVSPFLRTIETAYILSSLVESGQVYVDERIAELKESHADGTPLKELPPRSESILTDAWWTTRAGEETFRDLYARIQAFILYCETTFVGKNIVVITHGSPQNMFEAIAASEDEEGARQFLYKRYTSDRPFRENVELVRLGEGAPHA
jgi:broad specificity phosphatase PhoE